MYAIALDINIILLSQSNETQIPPSPFEVYHKLHFNAQKEGWQNDDARVEYVSFIISML